MKRSTFDILAVSMIMTACILTSCEKDPFKKIDPRFVTMSISSENSPLTKAAAENMNSKTIDLSAAGIDLIMNYSESITNDSPWSTLPKTKAEQSTITTLEDEGFDVAIVKQNTVRETGWATKVTDTYWQIVKSSVSKEDYNKYNDTQRVMWPDGTREGSTVWGYYGIDNFNFQSISYSFPSGSEQNDAVGMTDILVAKSYEPHGHPLEDECVRLHFFHPLSKISFEIASGVTNISKIQINNIYTAGSVKYNESADFNPYEDGAYKNAFGEWTIDPNSLSSYSQTANESGDYNFYIIPQDLENVTLTIYAVNDGVEYALTTTNLGTTDWKAGMSYNYKFTNAATGDISIDIKEQGNVIVENTNYSAVYVRAAVVGNWLKDGIILQSWTPSGSDINTVGKWNRVGNYYYYIDPVLGYETIKEDLINGITEGSSPVDGAALEVKVAVQAVPYDTNKSNIPAAWPKEAKEMLNTL